MHFYTSSYEVYIYKKLKKIRVYFTNLTQKYFLISKIYEQYLLLL